jgi:hypothetical protein
VERVELVEVVPAWPSLLSDVELYLALALAYVTFKALSTALDTSLARRRRARQRGGTLTPAVRP